MDNNIDELFAKLFKIKEDDSSKSVTRILVTLNYMLSGVFQQALDLVELHQVIRRDSILRSKKGETENYGHLQGIFTQHKWDHQGYCKEVWTVQPVVKEKKGAYTASPLQGAAWGYLVDLKRWYCSCQEFTKSKYTNGGGGSRASEAHDGCGWGGMLLTDSSDRVPVCIHIVAVLVFTKGRDLFNWMEQQKQPQFQTKLHSNTTNGIVDEFPSKSVSTFEEWIVLCSV